MKRYWLQIVGFFCVLILIISLPVFTQEDADPLAGRRSLGTTTELFSLWSQGPTSSTQNAYQKIYDYLAPFDTINFYPPDQRMLPQVVNEESGDWAVYGNRNMNLALGDFNEDGLDDVIAAWTGPNNRINLMVPFIDPNTLSWNDAARLFSPGPLVNSSNEANSRIHLAVADFDGDREDEFVLAYLNADETIHLEIYDTDSTRTPQFKASINDEAMPADPVSLSRLSVAAGDFNSDGKAEIVLAFRDEDGGPGSDWALIVKIYSVVDANGNYNLESRARTAVHNQPGHNVGPMNIEAVTGDLDLDTRPEIAFVCSFFQGSTSGDDTFLYFLDVSRDLNTISFDNSNRAGLNVISSNEMEALDMDAGDLNGDGRDDIALSIGANIRAYASDDDLVPILKGLTAPGSVEPNRTYQYLEITDFDRDLENEVVLFSNVHYNGSNGDQQFKIKAFDLDSTMNQFTLKAELIEEEVTPGDPGTGRGRHHAMIAGDFDGDKIHLGKPKRYYESEIRQPLVVLNSPPVHFDIINGTTHDVNSCYNGQSCGHEVTYSQSTTTVGEMSTTITMDWGVDTTISGDAEAYGNSIKRSMTNSYGEGFSHDETRRETFRINFSATAVAEDLVFGTVMDYVIWEYPVYASGTLRGYMTVVEPKIPTKTWYSSESWTGKSYIPNHEPGNIWSYHEYNNLTENDYLEEAVKLDNNVRFQLSPTSSFTWGVDWSSWNGTSTSASKSIGTHTGFGWSAGGEVEVFGTVKSVYGEDMNSTYSESELSTHTSSIQQDIQVDVQLGTISTADHRYNVTPYCYWGKNGALVVDYAARPELAPQGLPETFWQREYGHAPDPAFMLPFRFHPEKGWPLNDETQRQLTKDLIFFPSEAQVGDTVLIAARLHNFSLLDTPAPVKVKFYVGDPDNGGTVITSINGNTFATTNNFLPTRGSALAKMRWVVPGGIGNFPRIYAVIDPDNEISDEVHEDNNKAWAVLGTDITTGIPELPNDLPVASSFMLMQNYPNPFNPSTTIEYMISKPADVSLKIYDILGQEVTTLLKGRQAQGFHSVQFDASDMASGVYFYRLQVGPNVATRKMILMR